MTHDKQLESLSHDLQKVRENWKVMEWNYISEMIYKWRHVFVQNIIFLNCETSCKKIDILS